MKIIVSSRYILHKKKKRNAAEKSTAFLFNYGEIFTLSSLLGWWDASSYVHPHTYIDLLILSRYGI
jgi:hypothetical protein